MAQQYSTAGVGAKSSDVIRRVRAGQRIVIAYRGEKIAEIRPIEGTQAGLEKSLGRLEDEGILSRGRKPSGDLRPLAKKPGALARFLGSRE